MVIIQDFNIQWFYAFFANNNATKEMWQRSDTDSILTHKLPFPACREYQATPLLCLLRQYRQAELCLEPEVKTLNKRRLSSCQFP